MTAVYLAHVALWVSGLGAVGLAARPIINKFGRKGHT